MNETLTTLAVVWEGGMRCCSLLCLAFCFMAAVGGSSHATGIEAAENAEKLVESCHGKNVLSVPQCLNKLEFTGKPFSGIGRLEEVRRSLIGNLFAFVAIGKYRVACKVTKQHAEALNAISGPRTVLISGVMESYQLTFNLHYLHHLRLTPYCSIEPAV